MQLNDSLMLAYLRIPIILLIGMFAQPVVADVILLKNGDRLTGTIQFMEQRELVFIGTYAEMTIPWNDVVMVNSENELTVELFNARKITGRIRQSTQGVQIFPVDSQETVAVSLSDISSINPYVPYDMEIAGEIHLGGSKASGNTRSQSINADLEISAKIERNKWTLGAEYHQAANGHRESANNIRAYGKYDRYIRPDWYAFLNLDYTKDRFQDLEFRSAVSAGMGHELWNNRMSVFSVEAGIAYAFEDYRQNDGRAFTSGRWAVDFRHWLWKDHLRFFHNHEGLASFEDFEDVLIRTRTGFKCPIYDGLDLLTQFNLDYDNQPAENKKTTTTRYVIGVGYNW